MKFNWEKSYKINQESMKSDNPRIKGMVQHHKDGVKIFTDGSLNPTESENCGAGVYVQHAGEESFSYNIGKRTVYMAELFAIKKSAQYIVRNKRHLKQEDICIYVDSQAAIASLEKVQVESKLLMSTQRLLNAAAKSANSP